jgi:LacI family transcriptional regulator
MPDRKKRATIRELAEHTGLSPAAVSYALRGMQTSVETQARVQEAAAELGYAADPIARALRGGVTGIVGVLVGSLADFWHQGLVHALQGELRGRDRHALLADADGSAERELDLARRLVDQRVDGLLVAPVGPTSDGWAEIAREVPLVAIGDALPAAATVGEVVFDNHRGVGAVLRHLHALGHRRIAVLTPSIEATDHRPTEAAVTYWAETLDLECTLISVPASLQGARGPVLRLLGRNVRPTALFCQADSIAYAVYHACAELGLEIPTDVSVCGFDDHPMSRVVSPPLTSVDWGVDVLARVATGFLLDALEGRPQHRLATMPPALRARSSTAPPPV